MKRASIEGKEEYKKNIARETHIVNLATMNQSILYIYTPNDDGNPFSLLYSYSYVYIYSNDVGSNGRRVLVVPFT